LHKFKNYKIKTKSTSKKEPSKPAREKKEALAPPSLAVDLSKAFNVSYSFRHTSSHFCHKAGDLHVQGAYHAGTGRQPKEPHSLKNPGTTFGKEGNIFKAIYYLHRSFQIDPQDLRPFTGSPLLTKS
jgi:hypothetical protein